MLYHHDALPPDGHVASCRRCANTVKRGTYGGTPRLDAYDFADEHGLPFDRRARVARERVEAMTSEQLAASITSPSTTVRARSRLPRASKAQHKADLMNIIRNRSLDERAAELKEAVARELAGERRAPKPRPTVTAADVREQIARVEQVHHRPVVPAEFLRGGG